MSSGLAMDRTTGDGHVPCFSFSSGTAMRKRNGKPTQQKRLSRKERTQAVSKNELLEFMKGEDRPLLLKEILQQLGLKKEEKQETKDQLRDLVHEGKIVRIRGNRYGLPSKMNLVVGRVKCHPDGYGFVIPEEEGQEDIFVGARNLQEAMHGDRVVVRVESVRKKGKEGRVIRILERQPPQGRGQVHEGEELFLCHPRR